MTSEQTETAWVPIAPGLFRLDSLERGEGALLGSRCRACSKLIFPSRATCPFCFAEEPASEALPQRGSLVSYSIVHQSTPEFEVPYTVGFVQLAGGVRVFGPIRNVAQDKLQVDMELEVFFEQRLNKRDGKTVVAYAFRSPRS